MKLVPRVCIKCGKPKGTMAFRYTENGVTKRDYFHLKCFAKIKPTK